MLNHFHSIGLTEFNDEKVTKKNEEILLKNFFLVKSQRKEVLKKDVFF